MVERLKRRIGHPVNEKRVKSTNKQKGTGTLEGFLLECDPLEEFGQDHEIEDQRRCQERIFTRVVNCDGVETAHHDFRGVLVHGAFTIANIWDILDDHLKKSIHTARMKSEN